MGRNLHVINMFPTICESGKTRFSLLSVSPRPDFFLCIRFYHVEMSSQMFQIRYWSEDDIEKVQETVVHSCCPHLASNRLVHGLIAPM